MFTQNPAVVEEALIEHWGLPRPVTVAATLPPGVTADIWLVRDGAQKQYVAKFAYEAQEPFEAGLRIAEHVEVRTGLRTGRPIRDRSGALTVMLPSVPGQRHPLALLEHIDGVAVAPDPAEAAELLSKVHSGLSDTDATTTHAVFDYLTDDSIDFAAATVIRPVLHRIVADALERPELTWGTCYGDDPEAIRAADGQLALIDWGGVLHAPLLWDVAEWMAAYAEPDQHRFVAACRDRITEIGADEFAHLDKLVRLRDARTLRFLAYRVLHADHYASTKERDLAGFRRCARRLGVQLD